MGGPFMGGGPYMSGFPTFPTFLTIGSQKQSFRRGFFGEGARSKNFFLSLGR